jgi:hypothetical protein
MAETAPASSVWPRLALAALAVALVGFIAYIIHLQGSAPDTGQRAAAVPTSSRSSNVASAPAAVVGSPVAISEAAIEAVLNASQQQAMEDVLKPDGAPGRKAVFHIQQNNPDTGAVQAALARVFERSGWQTSVIRTPYPLKNGIYLLAAEEHPPLFVEAVNNAFSAAGFDVQYLTGYRAFFLDRKQQNPNWRGPELAEGQEFTVVIGSKPTPKPAGQESSGGGGM